MTISKMREKKKELGYTNEKIAELSGVPLGTVQKIFAGVTESPRYDTLKALEELFCQAEEPSSDRVAEALSAYHTKRQGEYTLEDYYALPDEQRAELIDGVLYDMASPSSVHQMLIGEIFHQLKNYIREKQGTCMAMIAPLDVQLDCDDKTMLQPDILVVCSRDLIISRCIYGAPDFIVEILSKSTRKKDMIIKLNKYLNAGVREYWIVDPDKKKVIIYDFAGDDYPVMYGFDAKIPVHIFDGACVVDFAEIYDSIRFLYEREEKN